MNRIELLQRTLKYQLKWVTSYLCSLIMSKKFLQPFKKGKNDQEDHPLQL